MGRLAQRLRRDDGQVLAVLACGLFVALLMVAGLVIDVGHAYVVKRKLQATADAAATAAAYDLPSVTTAAATAVAYGPTGKNTVSGATQTTSAWCLSSIATCYGTAPGTQVPLAAGSQANGLVVTEHAQVPTTFLRLFGKTSFDVSAKAVACGICGSTKLDVVLVLDRTGSMSGAVSALTAGAQSFLTALNPDLDRVGLVVLPPGPACGSLFGGFAGSAFPFDTYQFYTLSIPIYAYSSNYTSQYLAVPLTSDFQDPASGVYHAVSCLTTGGPTSYKGALAAAYAELQANGRPDAQKVIVFESDGAANDAEESAYNAGVSKLVSGQRYYAASSTTDVRRPCQAAVDYANSLKPDVTFYTVAYGIEDAGGDHTCYASPFYNPANGSVVGYRQAGYEEPGSASNYLAAIASKPADAFDATKADPTAIVQSFNEIASKIQGASLVPADQAPGS